MNPTLPDIAAKLAAGQRLDQADGEALFASADLHEVGRLAHEVRRRMHGDVAFYNVNRHINYTNVCVLACRVCGFRRRPGDPDAYTLSVEQVIEQARQADATGATEVHIVGGLHPTLPLDYYVQILSGIRQACPRLHRKALTAIEIVHIARLSKLDVQEVLAALIEAGLDSLPGGGAEVFSDRVHRETFRGKAGADDWFAVHRAAHALGLPSNATLLYGHVETPAERVAHMIRLRELQDETTKGALGIGYWGRKVGTRLPMPNAQCPMPSPQASRPSSRSASSRPAASWPTCPARPGWTTCGPLRSPG